MATLLEGETVDEAKTDVVTSVEPQTVETEPEQKPDPTLKANAALQRELGRVRARLTQAEQRAADLDGIKTALDAVVQTVSGQELDESGKAIIGQVRQLRQSQSATEAQRAALTREIHDVVQSIGVQSWDDPRVADVVAAFDENDLVDALHVAKQIRRQERAKSQEEVVAKKVVNTEDIVKAEVARQLKESGVREVDKTKAVGGASTAPTLDELLAKNIHTMTPAQAREHSAALLAARRG